MKCKLIFLNSHPIQYFAPLYQAIAEDGTFDLEVWYCSRHGLQNEQDIQFGKSIKWDIPLLSGYQHFFIKNHAFRPSIYGFWGLANLSVISRLWRLPRHSVVVAHGWAYFSNWLLLIFGRLFGHAVCLRGEAPVALEVARQGWRNGFRHQLLRRFLFPLVNFFLYVGQQNRLFYQYFGVPPEKMVFTPYAVDNRRFQEGASRFSAKKEALREELGLPKNAFILLYSGKFISKKRPLDLLSAVVRTKAAQICAVFVGEGELRPAMEQFVQENHLENRVFLTGFINQTAISKYYAVADAYVMCSDAGETWGLSTNEAMNFSLPILLSDQVGCATDLLKNGENGYLYRCSDADDLSQKIQLIAAQSGEHLAAMGRASLALVTRYSFESIIAGLKQIN